MANHNFVRLGCLGILLCYSLQVSAFFSNEPTVNWTDFDPTKKEPKFKINLPKYDGKDPCTPGKETCATDLRNEIMKDNDFDDEDFLAECTTDVKLIPAGTTSVCWLKNQRRSKRTLGATKKTVLEIQVYLDTKSKKAKARFSEPYGDED